MLCLTVTGGTVSTLGEGGTFRGLIDHHPDIEEKVLEALEERVRATKSA